MNRRIAKKVRKRWKEAYDQGERIRAFNDEIGIKGKAQREAFASVFKTDPQPSQYESGWWPKGRLIHHLGIRKRCRYTQRQVQRSYQRLPREERMEWHLDCRMIQVREEREAYEAEHGGWALAQRDMERWSAAMGAFMQHLTSRSEATA